MKANLFISLKITALTMILFGVFYPCLITSLGWLLTPDTADGERIEVNGRTVGFDRIGQSFTSPAYFHGRPSAVEYNAASTGGSNKGPTNPEYLGVVEERIHALAEQNPTVNRKDIPVELVTASGGGLDPHISPAAAQVQVSRISKVRGIPEDTIRKLIEASTEPPLFGLLGPPVVHVLRLNVALDQVHKEK